MADLQKLPIQAKEVIGADVYAVPTVTERVPSGRTMFDPYRILTVSGEKQQDVQVRVNGLDNSFVPNKLTKVILENLTMTVGSVQSRGKTKREIIFTADRIKPAK
ncbi:hypothetical protein MK394_00455 [Streptococcus sanguinis]|jgi:hypothetical protein|uniref:hypothetical protein n=1 Tax=Streptococcus TaxID=1301 RepID=UPI001CBCD603|nr:hypothetical protein [Streptococcus sanguinis]MBZ2068778.1 hypothetical protein [Streptococcus sanguinis]MCY7018125.1 hypothetical protein [Streptococcus sanguinis]MCY7031340.1 hypothetical protein [Streptococcus sanguinis]